MGWPMTKEERLRAEGMSFCLRFLEQNGNSVEALKAEIRRRGAAGIPIGVTPKQEKDYCSKVKRNCLTTVLLVAVAALHDEFGFGSERAARFVAKFNEAAGYLQDDAMNWEELQQGIIDRLGFVKGLNFLDGEIKVQSGEGNG